MLLKNRHALITGGGTGIGAAIAEKLAKVGAQVTICGRTIENLESVARTNRITPIVMDVTCEQSVCAATAKAVANFGGVDIHVANAGIAQGCNFENMSLEFWLKIMNTNLNGAYLSIRESLKSMNKNNWGRIITIASVAGLRGLKGASAYTVSKHGLVGLTRALSEEFIGSGITANAICPGYVQTPMFDRNAYKLSQELGIDTGETVKKLTRLNRHNKILSTEEIASTVLWLCSPGSKSINGQAIPITGGQV